MPLPYKENFENTALYTMPYCWDAGEGTVRVMGAGHNSERCFYAYVADSLDYVDLVSAEMACGSDSLLVTFYVTANQGYSDSSYHYHQLDTRLQVFAAEGDSLMLVYDDTVAYGSEWHRIDIKMAPMAYGTRLLFRPLRSVVGIGSMTFKMDDLSVKAMVPQPQCEMITEVDVVDVGYTQASIEWTPQGDEQRWEVYMRGEGVNTLFETDSARVTIVNLAHNTAYAFMVRPMCNDTLTGPWSDTIWFTTPGCLPVNEVSVVSVADSAVVSWRLPDMQSAWDISYGPAGFLEGSGELVHIESQPSDSGAVISHTLTGLAMNEEYDVYVRAVCGENLRSLWSARVSFSTGIIGVGAVSERCAVTIRPNPTAGVAVVDGLTPGAEVSLFDQNGRCRSRRVAAGTELLFEMTDYPAGVYYLHITTMGGLQVLKLIKK
jgi:hypothetical protein